MKSSVRLPEPRTTMEKFGSSEPLTTREMKFPWVSSTPLGRPVVPEV